MIFLVGIVTRFTLDWPKSEYSDRLRLPWKSLYRYFWSLYCWMCWCSITIIVLLYNFHLLWLKHVGMLSLTVHANVGITNFPLGSPLICRETGFRRSKSTLFPYNNSEKDVLPSINFLSRGPHRSTPFSLLLSGHKAIFDRMELIPRIDES